MRKKIIFGLLFIFCYSEVKPLLPFLDYYLNYEFISEVLCINKDTPSLNCNGKCYLSQQLDKAQESEKQNKKIPTIEQDRITMIICDYKKPIFNLNILNKQKIIAFYQFSIKDSSISPPTPPPQC